jgi:hypothetical protein
MPLITERLAAQLQRHTDSLAYVDAGYYIPAGDLSSLNDYGQPTTSTSLIPVSCAFTDKPAVEKWQGYADVSEIAAEARWTTPTPSKGGQFKLSERFGSTITEQTFEIVGIQNRGAFGYVCALKAVAL